MRIVCDEKNELITFFQIYSISLVSNDLDCIPSFTSFDSGSQSFLPL